jgi:hypothetical protein
VDPVDDLDSRRRRRFSVLSPLHAGKEATIMAKVGHFVIDPKAGAYCQITLDSGEKILVNHDKGALKGGRLTIEVTKFMGLSSDRIFACDLESPQGVAALGRLTRDARPGTSEATPLGALVEYVKPCASVAEVKTKCAALTPGS